MITLGRNGNAKLGTIGLSANSYGAGLCSRLSYSVGMLSAAEPTLGMTGLFFLPAAASRRRPDVIRRRSRAPPARSPDAARSPQLRTSARQPAVPRQALSTSSSFWGRGNGQPIGTEDVTRLRDQE